MNKIIKISDRQITINDSLTEEQFIKEWTDLIDMVTCGHEQLRKWMREGLNILLNKRQK